MASLLQRSTSFDLGRLSRAEISGTFETSFFFFDPSGPSLWPNDNAFCCNRGLGWGFVKYLNTQVTIRISRSFCPYTVSQGYTLSKERVPFITKKTGSLVKPHPDWNSNWVKYVAKHGHLENTVINKTPLLM